MIKQIQKNRGGFTLVEIMIVVAIIALLAAIATPSFLRARKRSQATTMLNNLRLIDAAKDQFATEFNVSSPWAWPTGTQLAPYLKAGTKLRQAAIDAGEDFVIADPSSPNVYYVADSYNHLPYIVTYGVFADVIDQEFWLPFENY